MKLNPLCMFLSLLIGLIVVAYICKQDWIEGLTNNNSTNSDYTITTAEKYNGYDPTTTYSARQNAIRGSNSSYVANPLELDEGDNTTSSLVLDDGDYNNQYRPFHKGIPRSQVPPGAEDLYILKSEIVPPVCPACPSAPLCPRQKPCPACPPCARCPEPAFECKKVPNYSSTNTEYLPRPVLNDFSQFGM